MIGPLRRLIPDVIRRSYVLKFGITLLILGLTVGAIGFLATDQIQNEVRGGVNQDLSNLASQEAKTFENWNERNMLVAQTLAESQQASQGSAVGMQSFITDRMQRREVVPDVAAIHYVDVDDNTTMASSSQELARTNLSSADRPWASFLGPRSQAPEDTRVLKAYEVDGSPRIAYVRRAQNQPDKAVVYVVNVSKYESGGQANPGTVTYIVDVSGVSSGTILYDSAGSQSLRDYPRDYYGVVKSVRGMSGTEAPDGTRVARIGQPTGSLASSVPQDYGEEQYVVSYARIEGTDYAVLVHTPSNQAYGFVTTVSRFGFLATLAGVLVIGIIGAVLGRNTATAIDRLRKKTEEMEQGNLDVDFETERIDNVGRLYDGLANMRDALKRQITEAREAREEAELAREEAEQTSRHLQAKANEYRDVMQACAAGDLSNRMQPSQRNEAMHEIAQEFNAMIAELEKTVQQLKDFANEVATSSEEVTASAEEVRSASQQVTRSIQEISEGAERQNDSLQSVSREMSGLSTTVEEIASLSNEVADLAERTAKTGRRGREAAQEAIAGMNQIETESQDAVEQITTLEEEMAQIDELIEFITDVADQTNMLALNANIEAARSSDSGEGFAVVANEVKELAEETKEAAEDIEQRLETIQDQTEDTVDSVKTTGDRIAENTESVRNAVEALDEIAGYAQETNTGVQEISAATEEQAASTEEVVAMVDEAATISEQTSTEAENVAAAAEEQTTAMTEVSDSASELSQQASRLSEALDRFSTNAEGEITAGTEGEASPGPVAPELGTDAADEGPAMEELSEGDLPAGVEELAEEFDDDALGGAGADDSMGSGGGADFEPPGETDASAPAPDPEPPTDDLPSGVEELAGGADEVETDTETAEAEADASQAPPGIDDLAGDAGDDEPPAPDVDDALDDLTGGPSGDVDGGDGDGSPDGDGDGSATDDAGDAGDGDASAGAAEDASDGEAGDDAESPAGVGDLAGDDLAGEDLSLDDAAPGGSDDGGDGDTLGGTEPATFGDDPDGGGDADDAPPAGEEDDMFSFVEGEDEDAEAQSEEGDD